MITDNSCHVRNTAQKCRLGLSQDSDLADILKAQNQHQVDSCANSEVIHLFQQVGCARNKHRSHTVQRKLRLFFLMQVFRRDGIPALDLWDLVIQVFHSSPNKLKKSKDRVQGNLLRNTPSNKHTQNQTKTPIQHDTLELNNVDHVSSNAKSFQFGSMLYIFEDNEAVIKMIVKSRSPTMRHVSRTQRKLSHVMSGTIFSI